MKSRCSDINVVEYPNYGGRGIKVCERWDNFANFLIDMGERPVNHSLDRIDNDGDYEPSNCRWTDRITQNNNSRHNRHITYKNKTLTLSQWARELNMKRTTIGMRLNSYGWSVERALTERVG